MSIFDKQRITAVSTLAEERELKAIDQMTPDELLATSAQNQEAAKLLEAKATKLLASAKQALDLARSRAQRDAEASKS